MAAKRLSDIKKQREEEDEKFQEIRKLVRKDDFGAKEKETFTGERIKHEIEECDILINQIDSLYRQFMAGVESKPPHELQKKLEDKIHILQSSTKNTTALRFRFSTIQTRLGTYKDRWDRLLKDLETGKKKRVLLKK